MSIDALSVLCAQLTRDLLAIAKFLFLFLSSLYAKSFHGPTAQAVEPILSCNTPTDAYSRIVPFEG